MPQLRLMDGDTMPALGLGTWRADRGVVGEAVRIALELGYRHLDCAPVYGNEAEVGAALTGAIRDGVLKREQVWITSKLWNDCHDPQAVRPALERSLRDLGVDHLDLYLIHWPIAHRPGVLLPSRAEDLIPLEQLPLADTWAAMEALVAAGLTRHIGVSNFSPARLRSLESTAAIRPQALQIERHPLLQQTALLQHCQQAGIALCAYAPLGSGGGSRPPLLLEHPQLQAIAAGRKISVAQLLLAWGIGCGTAVLPKSVRRERLAQNLIAASLRLDGATMAAIAALDQGLRLIDGSFCCLQGAPYSQQMLWGAEADG